RCAAASDLSSRVSAAPPAVPSFPTRRSSDLPRRRPDASARTRCSSSRISLRSLDSARSSGSAIAGRLLRQGGDHDDQDQPTERQDRKSTRLNSSHSQISYAVFCLKKKNKTNS